MADIFKFQNTEYEQCNCETCQAVDDYLEIALSCNNKEELRDALFNLYEDAYEFGYRFALKQDADIKYDLLKDV